MSDTTKTIPSWLWAVLALIGMGAVALFFWTDRRPEPGPALVFGTPAPQGEAAVPLLFPEPAFIPLPLEMPSALAVTSEGAVYVAGEGAVLCFGLDGTLGRRYSIEGRPRAMAVSGDGRVYLAFPDQLGVLDTASGAVTTRDRIGWRTQLTSVAMDAEKLYVADAGNRVVHCYGLPAGAPMRDIGAAPDFVIPSPHFDVAFDAQGALWVVNPGKHALEQYRDDGTRVAEWNRPGMTPEAFCGCCNPIHIAFGPDNTLYTAEKGLARIKAFGPDTKLRGFVASPALFSGPEYDTLPSGVEAAIADLAADARGRVLAIDAVRKGLLVFSR